MQTASWLGSQYVRRVTIALPGNAYISAALRINVGITGAAIVFKRATAPFEWPVDADALEVIGISGDITVDDVWRFYRLFFVPAHPTANIGDLTLSYEDPAGQGHSYFTQDGGLSWLSVPAQ